MIRDHAMSASLPGGADYARSTTPHQGIPKNLGVLDRPGILRGPGDLVVILRNFYLKLLVAIKRIGSERHSLLLSLGLLVVVVDSRY